MGSTPTPPSAMTLPRLYLAVALLAVACRVHAGEFDLSIRTEPIAAGGRAGAERRADLAPGLPGLPGTGGRQRRPKLITFSTDSSQIGVELGFTVPLLKVPLQGARTNAGGGAAGGPGTGGALFKEPIDVNIGALFVAGSMLLTVMGIVPAVYQAFAKPSRPNHAIQSRSASSEVDEPGWAHKADHLLGAVEAALARRGVDAWSCGGRALCTALAGAAERVRRGGGKAGSMDLVLHGLARSPWVSEWVSGTKLQDAASGEEDSDHCMRRFTRCNLPKELTSLLTVAPRRPPPAPPSASPVDATGANQLEDNVLV